MQALHDPSPEVVAKSAWALGRVDRASPRHEVIDELTRLLRHTDGEVRRYSASALSEFGPLAKSAVPDLQQALNDPHMGQSAAHALGHIGSAARVAIPDLAKLLKSPQSGDRINAAEALCKLRPIPQEMLVAVHDLLRDEDPLVRQCVQRVLDKHPPPSMQANLKPAIRAPSRQRTTK